PRRDIHPTARATNDAAPRSAPPSPIPSRPSSPTRRASALRGCNRDFRYGPTSPLPRGVERADHPVAQLVRPFQQVEGSHARDEGDRKSTRLNSSHVSNSYAVFCLKKKKCPVAIAKLSPVRK